jgi:hypothetical protein
MDLYLYWRAEDRHVGVSMKHLRDASRMRQVFAGTIVSLKTGMPHRMTTNTALLIWIGLPSSEAL